jgi:hypothetical protein
MRSRQIGECALGVIVDLLLDSHREPVAVLSERLPVGLRIWRFVDPESQYALQDMLDATFRIFDLARGSRTMQKLTFVRWRSNIVGIAHPINIAR